MSYFASIEKPDSVVTAIDAGTRFPEVLTDLRQKYDDDIKLFHDLINKSKSSGDLLERIRSTSYSKDTRMSLLKMFRRCVSPVIDTEKAKKIRKVSTDDLIEYYGDTFKPIDVLRQQFDSMNSETKSALAALIGEYDTRGQLGYDLTERFFTWFEGKFENVLIIEGPRGAGKDIQLSDLFDNYDGSYPCDFVIKDAESNKVLAVGFARYDSTRGGAQSDDRTGGNANKVDKAKTFATEKNESFKLVFLADGPGLTHNDTWEEACMLDGRWNGRVRVTTLKTAENRITLEWLRS